VSADRAERVIRRPDQNLVQPQCVGDMRATPVVKLNGDRARRDTDRTYGFAPRAPLVAHFVHVLVERKGAAGRLVFALVPQQARVPGARSQTPAAALHISAATRPKQGQSVAALGEAKRPKRAQWRGAPLARQPSTRSSFRGFSDKRHSPQRSEPSRANGSPSEVPQARQTNAAGLRSSNSCSVSAQLATTAADSLPFPPSQRRHRADK
jgi:hypothetical protein